MAVQSSQTARQLYCLFRTVVDAADHTILKCDPAFCFLKIISACQEQFIHRIPSGYRHGLLPYVIIGGMQTDGKCDLQFFFQQFTDAIHQATGRYCYVSLADPYTILIRKQFHKPDQIIIIIQRLSHSHDDHIGYPLSGFSLDLIYLGQHLSCRKISGQSTQCRGTESTSHPASYLGRDTHTVAVVVLHPHTFYVITIWQFKEIFGSIFLF